MGLISVASQRSSCLLFCQYTGGPSSLQERGRDSWLRAVLCYKRLFTKACMGCKRFFLKERKNVMFLNKIDLPYCLVVFFVVCPRLRPFWSVFGELALFWCSTAKRKEKDKAEQWFPECPSLEANNSAGKLSPASILPGIQSRDVAALCPFSRFAVSPTDRSLVMLLFFARPASKFRTRLFQTALDPFTDRIVCRVTKISPARVASRAYGLFVCLSTAGRWNTTRQ